MKYLKTAFVLTFLRTDDGLFLIRRPVKEMEKTLRDSDYSN